MFKFMTRIALLSLVTLGSAVAQIPTGERFENETAGISLNRPIGWQTASLQQIQENRERVHLDDSQLQIAIQKLATAPLFVFTKFQEPHPNLNPSIQVMVRPAGSLAEAPPTELLKLIIAPLQKAFSDFTLVQAVQEAYVSELAAAHMRATYTLKTADGNSFKVLSRMWIIPRGTYFFLVGMSGPQDGPDKSDQEFDAALASIRFQK